MMPHSGLEGPDQKPISSSIFKAREKTRASCNRCAGQKIRCGKERPSCTRCAEKGLCCVYGPSQRKGRPCKSASRVPAASAPRARASPSISSSSTSSESSPRHVSTTSYDFADTISADLDPWLFASGGIATDGIDTSPDINMQLPDMTWTPEMSTPSDNDLFTEMCSPELGSVPGEVQDPVKMDSLSLPELMLQPQPQRRHCDCLSLLLQTVMDLHVPSEACSATLKNPFSGATSANTTARPVDNVLLRNREAIKTVSATLECPCLADLTVATSCYLAASKIIWWYGAIIGNDEPPSGDAGISPKTTSNTVVTQPISVGNFCLDVEDQRSLLARVVIKEVQQHVDPLLSRFAHSAVLLQASGSNNGLQDSLRLDVQRILAMAEDVNQRR